MICTRKQMWQGHKIKWERRAQITLFPGFKNSQCQGCDKISIRETKSSIALGEVSSGSVEGKISSKSKSVVSNHSREINKGICSQTYTCAYPSILMLVLEFHLLPYDHKSDWEASNLHGKTKVAEKRMSEITLLEQMEKVLTLPDLWSGTMKLNIVLSPGAGSSTVMVVKSYICTKQE